MEANSAMADADGASPPSGKAPHTDFRPIAKTHLEMPSPSPTDAPRISDAPSDRPSVEFGNTPNTHARPIMKTRLEMPPSPPTDAPADAEPPDTWPTSKQEHSRNIVTVPGACDPGKWILVGGVGIAVLGILSISCAGLGFLAYMASQETDNVARVDLKKEPDKAAAGVTMTPENSDKPPPIQDGVKKKTPAESAKKGFDVAANKKEAKDIETPEVLAANELADKKAKITQTLVKLGSDTAVNSDFTRLVKGLTHDNVNLRPQARKALNTYVELWQKNEVPPLQRADVPSLVALLNSRKSDDVELHSFAIAGVTRLGPQATAAARSLLEIAITNPETKVLASVLVALKATGVKSDGTLSLFEKHLDHPDASVNDPAASALLQLAPIRLPWKRVFDLVNRPNLEVRVAADKLLRQKLVNSTSKDLLDLRQGLKNPLRDVQLAVIDAIAMLKTNGKDAVRDIALLAGSSDKEISEHAVRALDSMDKLIEVARDNSDPEILKATLGELKSKGANTGETVMVYEKHLDHPDVVVQNLASLALVTLVPEQLTIAQLTKLMGLQSKEIRSSADRLLRKKLSTVMRKDVPELCKGLSNPVREVQLVFIDAIGSLKADGHEAASDLGTLLKSPDKEVSIRCCQVLEEMGKAGTKAAPQLAIAVASNERPLALAATHALCKVDPVHAIVKTRGIDLLLEDISSDVKAPGAYPARPLNGKSASALLDVGRLQPWCPLSSRC